MDISAAIVGTGLMGVAHTNALRENGVNIGGVMGSSEEKSKKFAVDYNLPKIYQSFDDILADPEIDVIHLTTPNYLHYTHAKAALLAGKHVVCEKPLTMTADESRELFFLAKQKKLLTAVNFNVRMYPMVQKAREMVLNGEIGLPRLIHGFYLQDWLLYPSDWNWRINPDIGGNLRTVGDIGSHWIDLVSYISGLKVREVFADMKIFHQTRIPNAEGKKNEINVQTEDYATVLFRFEQDVPGVMTVSQMCAGHKNEIAFEINASQSSLRWNGASVDELWVGHRDKPNQQLQQKEIRDGDGEKDENAAFPKTFNELYRRVYSYLAQGNFALEPDFPTFKDGHYGMLVLEAIEKSSNEKSWVKVNLEDLNLG
jgi:predicted dehydrogenase